MINCFDESIIEKNSQLFENSIVRGLNDAAQEVRSNSKNSYKIYS